MSLDEYKLQMEAAQLRMEDERLSIHEQAFIHQQAKATDKSGKTQYKNFDEFYGKTNKRNIKKIEKQFYPKKFAAEIAERNELKKQFSKADFELLNKQNK